MDVGSGLHPFNILSMFEKEIEAYNRSLQQNPEWQGKCL